MRQLLFHPSMTFPSYFTADFKKNINFDDILHISRLVLRLTGRSDGFVEVFYPA